MNLKIKQLNCTIPFYFIMKRVAKCKLDKFDRNEILKKTQDFLGNNSGSIASGVFLQLGNLESDVDKRFELVSSSR